MNMHHAVPAVLHTLLGLRKGLIIPRNGTAELTDFLEVDISRDVRKKFGLNRGSAILYLNTNLCAMEGNRVKCGFIYTDWKKVNDDKMMSELVRIAEEQDYKDASTVSTIKIDYNGKIGREMSEIYDSHIEEST